MRALHPQLPPMAGDSMDVGHETPPQPPQPPQPQPPQSPRSWSRGSPTLSPTRRPAWRKATRQKATGQRTGAAPMPYGMPRAQLAASMPPASCRPATAQQQLAQSVFPPTPLRPARARVQAARRKYGHGRVDIQERAVVALRTSYPPCEQA